MLQSATLSGTTRRVLLVDDDPIFVRGARAALCDVVDLYVVSEGHAALAAADLLRPELVIVDVLLRGTDAFGLLDQLRARMGPRARAVILLAKGPGAVSRGELWEGEFLGVHRRDAGPQALQDVVQRGLALSAPPCAAVGV
jgi:DNA-binding NarL/FixJ family response regulator